MLSTAIFKNKHIFKLSELQNLIHNLDVNIWHTVFHGKKMTSVLINNFISNEFKSIIQGEESNNNNCSFSHFLLW